MKYLLTRLPTLMLALVVGLIVSSSALGQANIVIENADGAGVGFNDTTFVPPANRLGGNNGATLGEQRLNAFIFAAGIWGARISSSPTITIRADWQALPCGNTSGTLGSAGAHSIRGNFPNAPFLNTWYSAALANALSGSDPSTTTAEIDAHFNLNIGNPGCLGSQSWYYGLDTNQSGSGINLVTVLLHEFAHGLGFQSFTDESNGQQIQDLPMIYDRFLLDNTTGKTWPQMTNAERTASAINSGNLVWNGPQVTADSSILTSGKDAMGHPRVFAPNPVDDGSSISHWDRVATPNQLMEPDISQNLTHSVTTPQDLTLSLLKDIGWPTGPPPPPASPTPTPSPPPNDNFANAQVLGGCSGTVNGTNVGATKEAGEPVHLPASPNSTKSVWYRWQAPSTTSVTITTAGSLFDTVLAVYTGSTVNALTLVPNGRNDDIPDVPGQPHDVTSSVTINVTAGQTYQIAVDGFDNTGVNGDTGSIKLNWTAPNCASAPTIMVEEGATTKAVAVDSITLVRGPFKVLNPNNFNTSDPNTRVILFTSSLGTSSTSNVTVTRNGIALLVENVGTVTGTTGLSASYIIVRLPTGLATGELPLTVNVFGVPSTNNPTLGISP